MQRRQRNRMGVRFRDGKLMIFREPDEVLLMHTWPDLEAVRKPSHAEPWKGFTPTFRLLKPAIANTGEADFGPAALAVNALDPAYEKLRAFLSFRQSLPRDIAGALERYTNRQWALMRICAMRPPAVDLLQQNPALGFSLAHYGRVRGNEPTDLVRAAELSERKQRPIARWLGFPNTNATVKVLGKTRPELVSLDTLTALRSRLHTDAVHKALGHLPEINAGVLALTASEARFQRVSPSLLREVAERPDERLQSRTASLLQDVRQMESVLGMGARPRRFDCVARLERQHSELTEAFLRHQKHLHYSDKLPEPPIPGTRDIIPLTTASDLHEEGRKQHNCVGGYAGWVRQRKCYIYRILRPERANLSIVQGPTGNWEIEQLFAACNQRVKSEAADAVQAWLSSESTGL